MIVVQGPSLFCLHQTPENDSWPQIRKGETAGGDIQEDIHFSTSFRFEGTRKFAVFRGFGRECLHEPRFA